MNIKTLGPETQYTIISGHSEKLGEVFVTESVYHSGPSTMAEFISSISGHKNIGSVIFPPDEKIKSFIECRKYKNCDSKEWVWRISKTPEQTTVDYGHEIKMEISPPDLLVMEVPRGAEDSTFVWPSGEKVKTGKSVIHTESPTFIGSRIYDGLYNCYDDDHQQIIILSVEAVRKMKGSPVISSLSWESLAEGIIEAFLPFDYTSTRSSFKERKRVVFGRLSAGRQYGKPKYLIVPILNDGAILIETESEKSKEPKAKLIYDHNGIEGEWAKFRQGRVVNSLNCVTAAVAAGALEKFANKSIEDYVAAGLHSGRKLHERGYGQDAAACFSSENAVKEAAETIKEYLEKPLVFNTVEIPLEDGIDWSIVKEEFLRKPAELGNGQIECWDDVKEKIFNIVKKGVDDDPVPVVKFDTLTAVLREEVEGLRIVRNLIGEYSNREKNKRPLSLAVFGYPGSGKSFSVKSVAKAVSHTRRKFSILEFNLSQFSEPGQLYEALHQVRDLSLSGFLPLVFWDEFDCDFNGQYGWLRYFLAPMQDGKFTQGQITHSVGDAIFVFAGGTSVDMQGFKENALSAKAAKAPDFLSRLHGFLDVPGLDHEDILLTGVLIRRALLLRSLLDQYAPSIDGDIDETVLTAFLCTSKYRFGARSMEAILMMSHLNGKTRFESSSLPSLNQIELHVDSSDWEQTLEGKSDLTKRVDKAALLDGPLIGW